MTFVYGRLKECATRRLEGEYMFLWCEKTSESRYVNPRVQEAIECYKRALIPADPHEITINLKLARIYRSLNEHSEAVAYNRRVIEVCQADCKPIFPVSWHSH